MKNFKKLILQVSFQIGVNIIGLPIFDTHDLSSYIIHSSKFHR